MGFFAMDILKTIIPAAGIGESFLPLTKAIPKEMLPLCNKPAIQYIIEEALQSQINQFTMVTSRNKQAISDYFDRELNLERILKESDQFDLIKNMERIIRASQFCFVRQSEPLGIGHAVLMAQSTIGKEYFGVMLPDDIITGGPATLGQLIRVCRQEKASVIAVQEVPRDCINSYGIIKIKKQITPNLFQVGSIIEKPQPKDAPSSLAVVGRYILSHKIFPVLEEMTIESEENLGLSDAVSRMILKNEKVYALRIQGKRYDIGNPIGWTKAAIGLSLEHPEYGPIIKKYIQDIQTPDSLLFNPIKNITHTL